jgi:hypothetical protein
MRMEFYIHLVFHPFNTYLVPTQYQVLGTRDTMVGKTEANFA